MRSSLRNRVLVFVFAISAVVFRPGALAESNKTSGDTILVVCAGMTYRNGDGATANQRFIPFADRMTPESAIYVALEDQGDFRPYCYHVEIIRADSTIQSEADLRHLSHHPSPSDGDFFLKRGDVLIIRPKVNYF